MHLRISDSYLVNGNPVSLQDDFFQIQRYSPLNRQQKNKKSVSTSRDRRGHLRTWWKLDSNFLAALARVGRADTWKRIFVLF